MGFWSSLFTKEVDSRRLSYDELCVLVRTFFKVDRAAIFYAQMHGYDEVAETQLLVYLYKERSEISPIDKRRAFQILINKLSQIANYWDALQTIYAEKISGDEMLQLNSIATKVSETAIAESFKLHLNHIEEFTVELVFSLQDIDRGNLGHKVDEKWIFFKPLFKNALLSGVDKYGEQDYSFALKECREFADKFFSGDRLKFYWPETLGWPLFQYAEEKLRTDNEVPDDYIPVDGIEFEMWCADKLQALGWVVQLTAKTGDQGVDLIANNGEVTVAVQCKRYSQPVGNSAVQEVFAGKQHIGADYACVIATAGYTKAAKEIGRSTQVFLIGPHDLETFVGVITGELET